MYIEDACFYRWLKQNFGALVKGLPELFEAEIPLWIITKTYHTRKCSISCWEGFQQDVSLEFCVSVPTEGGTIQPDGENVRVKTEGPGWAHYGRASHSPTTVVGFTLTLIVGCRSCSF
jgi:hypothetical protein